MSTFKIDHPNPSNKLPDGVPYSKRDHPEVPCIMASPCVLIIVLILSSPFILLAMIILVPLSYYTRRWEKKFISDMYAKSSEIFESSRGPVEYKMSGTAPYIFYVPGGGGGIDEIDEDMLKPTHQDRGVGVITYSRPGFRRTPISCGASWAEQADLIGELLDHLGIKSVVVCGRSGGGPTAIHFAARHPAKCDALFLFYCNIYPMGGCSNTAPKTPSFGWNMRFIYWLRSFSVSSWMSWSKIDSSNEEVVECVLDGLLEQESDYNDKERADEKTRLMVEEPVMTKALVELLPFIQMPASVRWQGYMNDQFRKAWDMQLPFDEINCPTLLIHGRRDGLNSFQHSRYGAKMIKGAKLILLEQGYHPAELCKEFPAAWEQALAMVKDPKAGFEAIVSSVSSVRPQSLKPKAEESPLQQIIVSSPEENTEPTSPMEPAATPIGASQNFKPGEEQSAGLEVEAADDKAMPPEVEPAPTEDLQVKRMSSLDSNAERGFMTNTGSAGGEMKRGDTWAARSLETE